MASRRLAKALTTPSKIASALDWKKMSGSILSLNVHADRIGLAVASHPSFGEDVHTLPSIHLQGRQRVDDTAKEQLSQIVKDHNVAGFVVAWPLQHDTGRMGAACGRVLFTLEQLIQEDTGSSPPINRSRPVCLWDGEHPPFPEEDGWGRDSTYVRTSEETEYHADEQRYHEDENMVTVKVWDDFFHAQWPELYDQQHQNPEIQIPPLEPPKVAPKSLLSGHNQWQPSLKTSRRRLAAAAAV